MKVNTAIRLAVLMSFGEHGQVKFIGNIATSVVYHFDGARAITAIRYRFR
jgi:hypothetical protein